ncbi:MAG: type IV pilus assembly protein PilM [Deltaproteobacteria bacterium]|nr:type IV pilus assembly protein PilM [Deltaproteobacteria bacterium]
MPILSRKRPEGPIVGLDIGTSALKVATVEARHPTYSVKKLGRLALPTGTIAQGEIIDALTLEGALKELFQKEEIRSVSVAFAVSGPAVLSKRISIPAMNEDELEAHLPVLAAQHLPCNPDESNLDFQILNTITDQAQTMELMLIAVEKIYLESFLRVIENADLHPVAVETVATAFSHLYEPIEIVPSHALIQMGAEMTHLMIFEKNLCIFHQTFLTGGQNISQDLREALHLSLTEAEALKINCSAQRDLPKETLTIMETSMRSMLTEVHQGLQFFLSQNPKVHLDKILLSGGASLVSALPEWTSQEFGYPTEYFSPFKIIDRGGNIRSAFELKQEAAIFSLALGLAMRNCGS